LNLSISSTENIQPGDVIAVGDVHGRYDLLDALLADLRGSQAVVILLGDMIDRGGQDIQVLDRVKKLLDDPESEGLSNFFVLMGNHEDMFIDAVEGPSQDLYLWLQNGGNFEQFDELQGHLPWIKELPIYMTIDETLFIHAGIWPGVDPLKAINAGRTDTLVWMREPFLSRGPEFEKWNPSLKRVVFGHTPKFDEGEGEPYTIPQGICIDSGAYFTDTLTSYNVTQDAIYQTNPYQNETATAAN